MSDSTDTEAHTIDITPQTQQGTLSRLPGSREEYRVVLPNGRGIGYIKSRHDGWHIVPDGAEEYPMCPESKEDAAWLLLTFRDKITPRLKP